MNTAVLVDVNSTPKCNSTELVRGQDTKFMRSRKQVMTKPRSPR